jgi:hypothetical protein
MDSFKFLVVSYSDGHRPNILNFRAIDKKKVQLLLAAACYFEAAVGLALGINHVAFTGFALVNFWLRLQERSDLLGLAMWAANRPIGAL